MNLSSNLFASVFQRSPVAQVVVNDELCPKMANQEFMRLTGLEEERLINQRLETVLPSLFTTLQSLDLGNAGANTGPVALEVVVPNRADGSEQRCELLVQTLQEDGLSSPSYSLTLVTRRNNVQMRGQRVTELKRERAARRRAEISAEIVERILGITDVALAHIDLNDLLRELLGRIRDVLQTDEASILLKDPGEDSLSLRVSLGPERLVRRPVRVRIGIGFVGRIAAGKHPIVLEDTSNFPFANPTMLERGVRSLMGVPMLVDDRVLGVVHVGMLTPRRFDESELHLLELAAARIALAIDRANLYQAERTARNVAEQAQRRNEILANASEILASSLDYQSTLADLTRFVVPEIAHLCTINVIGKDEIVRLIASTGDTPELEALVAQQRRHYPLALEDCPSVQSVAESGESVLIEEVTDDLVNRISADPQHLHLSQQAHMVSGMRVPMKSGGRVVGVISFWLSNTDRRFDHDDLTFAEDLAHRAALATDNAWHYEEARRAIGARDEFISIASHELKTPLTTVKGYVQLLRRHVRNSPTNLSRVIRTLGQLQDQVDRFEDLVDELLDVSRIQDGRIRLSYQDCDLAQIVKLVVERFEQSFDGETPHPIRLTTSNEIIGRWDPTRLDQVVTNLISNALKYSPEGSEVVISARVTNSGAELSVTDHGIGISTDDLEHVFQPFTRGIGASGIAPGAGLGLYISNEIVQRHGGTLTVRSKQGEGSTFTVRLPRRPDDETDFRVDPMQ